MPIRNLEKLFYPSAVAVIGASNRDGVAGHAVMHNLLQGGFEGPIMPVTASERAIAGVLSYPKVSQLPIAPDLALICGEEQATPELIRDLGERGTRAAILVAEDLSAPHNGGAARHQCLVDEARRHDVRLLGPNCLGVMVPGIGLNASIADAAVLPGGIAFVSQSSTIGLGVLDWARDRDIGFSYFISLGSGVDVDVADVIDYLGNDAMTRAILLFVEEITNGRAFMSASRGASRNKPILVIKSGRTAEGCATTFGGAGHEGIDGVYDAAFRRAGMLRVQGFGELFAAVETLGRTKPLKAERLAILANGRGITALAVDKLVLEGGRLASLAPETTEKLKALLPAGWPAVNPLIIDGEAPPERYGAAARTLLADRQVDALMVLHAPMPAVSATAAAAAVIKAVREARRPALTSWMGGERVAEARRKFGEAGIPTYDTSTRAVEAFMHLVRFHRNQAMLIETPRSMPAEFTPKTETARGIIRSVLDRGQSLLLDADAKAVLAAYGLNGNQPARADAFGHGDRGAPGAQLVRIGVAEDPVFGPFITFGHGGPAAEIIDDIAFALPPLNMSLAHELIGRTRVNRLLTALNPGSSAHIDRLCLALVQVSQMIVEIPEIKRLEISPLLVDDKGITVASAWLRVAPAAPEAQQRLAIRPYPGEIEEWFTLRDGRKVLLRPIRPEDEPAHYDFLSKVTPDDMRLRFFHVVRTLPHAEMARLTQIDYDREMAVIARADKPDGSGAETLGVVRIVTDLNDEKAEYAILVRSDMKGQGLGRKLMTKIIEICRARGTKKVIGLILCDNKRMLDMVHALGFKSRRLPDDDVMEVTLDLSAAALAA